MHDGHWDTCCRCKSTMWLPAAVYAVARERQEEFTFYCSNGHAQHYTTGETETDKLRRERDRLNQRLAEKDDDIRREREAREAAERQAAAARGQVTKIKKRVGNGVCPCCTRSFANLRRHMETKHPNVVAFNPEAVAS